MPERDSGPPPGLTPVALSAWAVKQLETATCEGEIRAAMRVLLHGPNEPHRMFICYVRRRLCCIRRFGVVLLRSPSMKKPS